MKPHTQAPIEDSELERLVAKLFRDSRLKSASREFEEGKRIIRNEIFRRVYPQGDW